MLVLTRHIGEKLLVGDDVWVEVLETCGTRVKLGFEAPDDVLVLREELVDSEQLPEPL